jgi:hypothetical protein
MGNLLQWKSILMKTITLLELTENVTLIIINTLSVALKFAIATSFLSYLYIGNAGLR